MWSPQFLLKRGIDYKGESRNCNIDDDTYFIAFIWKMIVAKSETGFGDDYIFKTLMQSVPLSL